MLEEVERRIKKLEDSRSRQNLNRQDLYSNCRVPPQQVEPTDLDKSMESMI